MRRRVTAGAPAWLCCGVCLALGLAEPEEVSTLRYGHAPLTEQLDDLLFVEMLLERGVVGVVDGIGDGAGRLREMPGKPGVRSRTANDEAAARLRLEMNSMPEELDEVEPEELLEGALRATDPSARTTVSASTFSRMVP